MTCACYKVLAWGHCGDHNQAHHYPETYPNGCEITLMEGAEEERYLQMRGPDGVRRMWWICWEMRHEYVLAWLGEWGSG